MVILRDFLAVASYFQRQFSSSVQMTSTRTGIDFLLRRSPFHLRVYAQRDTGLGFLFHICKT